MEILLGVPISEIGRTACVLSTTFLACPFVSRTDATQSEAYAVMYERQTPADRPPRCLGSAVWTIFAFQQVRRHPPQIGLPL